MKLYDCSTVADRDRGIQAAIEAVQRGELVVMPTDTVYGLGADAFKSWSVTQLLNAKGRGRQMPPPVLVGSRQALDGLVFTLDHTARELVEAFWPGALTVVVRHAPSLQWDLGDTNGTVAVRMPLHPVALEVLRETGPMAVSSANKTGKQPAATAEEAMYQLGYLVSVYLEAGVKAGEEGKPQLPSTIVDCTAATPRVLRDGAIPFEKLRDVVPDLIPLYPAEPAE